MTTPKLPTREDGGIDFEKCNTLPVVQTLMREAAAHERERCARICDTYTFAKGAAAAIRSWES